MSLEKFAEQTSGMLMTRQHSPTASRILSTETALCCAAEEKNEEKKEEEEEEEDEVSAGHVPVMPCLTWTGASCVLLLVAAVAAELGCWDVARAVPRAPAMKAVG